MRQVILGLILLTTVASCTAPTANTSSEPSYLRDAKAELEQFVSIRNSWIQSKQKDLAEMRADLKNALPEYVDKKQYEELIALYKDFEEKVKAGRMTAWEVRRETISPYCQVMKRQNCAAITPALIDLASSLQDKIRMGVFKEHEAYRQWMAALRTAMPIETDYDKKMDRYLEKNAEAYEFVSALQDQVDQKRNELIAKLERIQQEQNKQEEGRRAVAAQLLPYLLLQQSQQFQQTVPHQPLNCTSSRIGNQTYTNCY